MVQHMRSNASVRTSRAAGSLVCAGLACLRRSPSIQAGARRAPGPDPLLRVLAALAREFSVSCGGSGVVWVTLWVD
jgi:hypothetical protein